MADDKIISDTSMNTSQWEFENLVRKYLSGETDWETVHRYAAKMECENEAEFPGRHPLSELHLIFLAADAKDDPQFRASHSEIAALVSRLDAMEQPIQ